jgi:hypothetical protein
VGGGEISRAEESDGGGGQTGAEARCPDQRRQEIKAGGRAAEGAWPGEGDAKATGPREGTGREGCGAPAMAAAPAVGAPGTTAE